MFQPMFLFIFIPMLFIPMFRFMLFMFIRFMFMFGRIIAGGML